ncbi:carotenoid biosynthesis protein [Draconibacterium halophilum]|uniref:Carotenoid biosynthesis protein n=1 Tax=Draconibacterium halophilum TaxID=2706887 RepID=A0A6C0RFV2_9BACT|nr:carotenoid biosynthesis protein [Draconibacterium halophilum]QIA09019.1 carotenoid biosynthesis protein [Draconibacterium halophilum]
MSGLKQIANSIQANFRYVVIFIIIFYSVGFVGLAIPTTRPLFVHLTPFALLLSSVIVALFHSKFSAKTILVFLFIYVASFIVELIGVNTGSIFGNYTYGHGLGLKLFNTPLIIGINWLLLVYVSNSVLEKTNWNPIGKVFGASVLMLSYDILLEQVAPKLAMWTFSTSSVPIQNYVAWFILALLFSLTVHLLKINTRNRIAPVVFGIQALFFVLLLLTLN